MRAGRISGVEADRMAVSRLPLEARVADTTVQRAARFGVARVISTITPYNVPRRWAAALHEAGHDGMRYWPRFSLSASYRAVGLFGPAGADPDRPCDPAPTPGRAAAKAAGITVIDPPSTVPISDPPA